LKPGRFIAFKTGEFQFADQQEKSTWGMKRLFFRCRWYVEAGQKFVHFFCFVGLRIAKPILSFQQSRSITAYSQLTEEQNMLREMCRNFADTELVGIEASFNGPK
jgi:hypothetical protein